MNIGIVTIAYNGYGRFLPQWCQAIANLTIAPAQVTVVLGAKHGLSANDQAKCNALIPGIVWLNYRPPPKMGTLRNVAVKHTDTEWIQYLSADDVILPWAIEEYKKLADDSDYIVIRWQSIKTWAHEAPVTEHKSRLPVEMGTIYDGRGFVNNQSPYRKWIWQKNPYMPHDYPNAPFLAGAVELGARFLRTERPCTVYLQRLDSHCGTNLGRRGGKPAVPQEKYWARYWKKDAQQRIYNYYRE